MLNRCDHCGGSLQYDIETGKLKCIHCDSCFDPESYDSKTAAEEYQEQASGQEDSLEYETTVFTCPSCGAEISSTELSAVDYCLYCGSFVTLESRMEKVRKPELILPFSKSVKECKDIYRKSLRKKIYAPKEFRDESFIDGFKGIYIPYWCYDYSFGPDIHIRGEEVSRKGDYIVTQHYNIDCKVSGNVDGITYDASSTFDDDISSKIAPFPREKMKPFHSAYMFGFFGDIADIDEDVYQHDADLSAEEEIWARVEKQPEIRAGHPVETEHKNFSKDFNLQKKATLSMLPVWFLTWRKGDKVAYSVVNGDSGEIYAEIPISITRYLLISLLTAIPIFLLLNPFFTFTSSGMLKIAMLLSIFMIFLYSMQLDKIVRRIMHTDDRGFLSVHEDARKNSDENVSDNLFSILWEFVLDFFVNMKFVSIIFAVGVIVVFGEYFLIAALLIALLVPAYIIYRIYKDVKILKDMTVWIDLLGALVAIVISVAILWIDPAPDQFYYFASIFCMLSVGFTAVRMMGRYNDLIIRPVPHFFDRKGGQ